jgi:hypothetical protein
MIMILTYTDVICGDFRAYLPNALNSGFQAPTPPTLARDPSHPGVPTQAQNRLEAVRDLVKGLPFRVLVTLVSDIRYREVAASIHIKAHRPTDVPIRIGARQHARSCPVGTEHDHGTTRTPRNAQVRVSASLPEAYRGVARAVPHGHVTTSHGVHFQFTLASEQLVVQGIQPGLLISNLILQGLESLKQAVEVENDGLWTGIGVHTCMYACPRPVRTVIPKRVPSVNLVASNGALVKWNPPDSKGDGQRDPK